jgi:hypothetical protein
MVNTSLKMAALFISTWWFLDEEKHEENKDRDQNDLNAGESTCFLVRSAITLFGKFLFYSYTYLQFFRLDWIIHHILMVHITVGLKHGLSMSVDLYLLAGPFTWNISWLHPRLRNLTTVLMCFTESCSNGAFLKSDDNSHLSFRLTAMVPSKKWQLYCFRLAPTASIIQQKKPSF